MRFTRTIVAASLAALCSPVFAGGFVMLPETSPLRVTGVNNPASDPLFLGDGWTPEANGYTRVARRISSVLYDGNDIGLFQDFVYRSNADNTLVFASQFTLEVEEQNGYVLEVNDIFRRGFAGYDVSVAWYGEGDRLRSAAHSTTGRTRPQAGDVFSDDIVDLRIDISIEEENPVTAWYLIKTNATAFDYLEGAVSITQAAGALPNDDDPPFRAATFEGFAPVPVPEPSEYAMLLAGLGILGVANARRKRRN